MIVSRLLRVSLTTLDLARAQAFYCGILGFSPVGGVAALDRSWLDAMGVPDASGQAITLRLGMQALEIVAFDPPGQPYPSERAANDPWFQHIAIVVSDMPAAWEKVRQGGITPISSGGPQRLPPNAGSVVAVKFRDPDGHPLELLHFPAGTGDGAWQQPKGALFLGYDHSAIVVRDTATSIGFYNGALGFAEMSRSLNHGVEQEHLDGLPGDIVDVVALRPADQVTPHLELLGYRTPPGRSAISAPSPRDVAATRLIVEADDLSGTIPRLAVISSGGSRRAGGTDPDGHWLVLVEKS